MTFNAWALLMMVLTVVDGFRALGTLVVKVCTSIMGVACAEIRENSVKQSSPQLLHSRLLMPIHAVTRAVGGILRQVRGIDGMSCLRSYRKFIATVRAGSSTQPLRACFVPLVAIAVIAILVCPAMSTAQTITYVESLNQYRIDHPEFNIVEYVDAYKTEKGVEAGPSRTLKVTRKWGKWVGRGAVGGAGVWLVIEKGWDLADEWIRRPRLKVPYNNADIRATPGLRLPGFGKAETHAELMNTARPTQGARRYPDGSWTTGWREGARSVYGLEPEADMPRGIYARSEYFGKYIALLYDEESQDYDHVTVKKIHEQNHVFTHAKTFWRMNTWGPKGVNAEATPDLEPWIEENEYFRDRYMNYGDRDPQWYEDNLSGNSVWVYIGSGESELYTLEDPFYVISSSTTRTQEAVLTEDEGGTDLLRHATNINYRYELTFTWENATMKYDFEKQEWIEGEYESIDDPMEWHVPAYRDVPVVATVPVKKVVPRMGMAVANEEVLGDGHICYKIGGKPYTDTMYYQVMDDEGNPIPRLMYKVEAFLTDYGPWITFFDDGEEIDNPRNP